MKLKKRQKNYLKPAPTFYNALRGKIVTQERQLKSVAIAKPSQSATVAKP